MLTPRAGARTQLVAAALMWLIGASILIVRGVGYIHSGGHWHFWALAAALALGVLKSRYLLDRAARKAVARIHARGKACFFGFFSWRTWIMVGVMMGTGITIRHTVVNPSPLVVGIMGALYLGIGEALFMGDRIFWRAALEPIPVMAEKTADV